MNNTETMQALADKFNKAGEKNHPAYKWVVVKSPDEPELIPDIHLVRKDGSSRRIDKTTCIRMKKVFDRIGIYSFESQVESLKALRTYIKDGVVTIKALGDVSATTEDIEKLGAEYDKHAKEIFNSETYQSAQNLADALNEIGKSRQRGLEFVVTEDGGNRYYIGIERSPSLMNIISSRNTMVYIKMLDSLSTAINASTSEKIWRADTYSFGVEEGCVLTDKEIKEIAVAYHKEIQELEVPTSKKITNKVMNSSIVKTLKKARS